MPETRTMSESQRLIQLEDEVRDARDRFDEHRNGPQPSPTKLRKLQEACRYAEARLQRARGA
jgi:hypothetical protein